MYINPKYYGDPEPLYQYVPKAKQVAALKFVLKNLNELQDWIINDKITAIIGPTAKPLRGSNAILQRDVDPGDVRSLANKRGGRKECIHVG